MIYILDAYNVIHKIPKLESELDKDLRSARNYLISLCHTLLSNRGDISQIILVFDGKSQFHDLPNKETPKLKIVFSDTGETADTRICQVLDSLPENRKRLVVSDDNSVYNNARSHKATPMKVADFQKLLEGKEKRNASRKSSGNEKNLSAEDAKAINDDYKKMLGLD